MTNIQLNRILRCMYGCMLYIAAILLIPSVSTYKFIALLIAACVLVISSYRFKD